MASPLPMINREYCDDYKSLFSVHVEDIAILIMIQ